MAKGYWRNWEEVKCDKCNTIQYLKDVRRNKNKCLKCGAKMFFDVKIMGELTDKKIRRDNV